MNKKKMIILEIVNHQKAYSRALSIYMLISKNIYMGIHPCATSKLGGKKVAVKIYLTFSALISDAKSSLEWNFPHHKCTRSCLQVSIFIVHYDLNSRVRSNGYTESVTAAQAEMGAAARANAGRRVDSRRRDLVGAGGAPAGSSAYSLFSLRQLGSLRGRERDLISAFSHLSAHPWTFGGDPAHFPWEIASECVTIALPAQSVGHRLRWQWLTSAWCARVLLDTLSKVNNSPCNYFAKKFSSVVRCIIALPRIYLWKIFVHIDFFRRRA